MSLLAVRPGSTTTTASDDCVAVGIGNSALPELYQADVRAGALLVMDLAREVTKRVWETNECVFAVTRALWFSRSRASAGSLSRRRRHDVR